jgi:hypothetical protein
MLLAGCQRDVYKPKEEIIECPDDDLVGHDTASDTGDTDPADTADTTCTDATGTYAVGESWTCEDGCNTCGCQDDGSIVSTDMDCG